MIYTPLSPSSPHLFARGAEGGDVERVVGDVEGHGASTVRLEQGLHGSPGDGVPDDQDRVLPYVGCDYPSLVPTHGATADVVAVALQNELCSILIIVYDTGVRRNIKHRIPSSL